MTSTTSVSKGCFVFNKNKFLKKKTGKKVKQNDVFCDDPWYKAYKLSWNWVEDKYETLRHDIFSSVLNELVSFVHSSYESKDINSDDVSAIPTAALLTGINMPDHGALFSTLCDSLHKSVSPHVATLYAHKCKTIRHAIEQMTSQFMNASSDEDSSIDESDDEKPVKVKKANCNMLFLESWYQQQYRNKISSETEFNTVEDVALQRSPRKLSSRFSTKTQEEEDKNSSETEPVEAEKTKCNVPIPYVSNGQVKINGYAPSLLKTPDKQTSSANIENELSTKFIGTPSKSTKRNSTSFNSPRKGYASNQISNSDVTQKWCDANHANSNKVKMLSDMDVSSDSEDKRLAKKIVENGVVSGRQRSFRALNRRRLSSLNNEDLSSDSEDKPLGNRLVEKNTMCGRRKSFRALSSLNDEDLSSDSEDKPLKLIVEKNAINGRRRTCKALNRRRSSSQSDMDLSSNSDYRPGERNIVKKGIQRSSKRLIQKGLTTLKEEDVRHSPRSTKPVSRYIGSDSTNSESYASSSSEKYSSIDSESSPRKKRRKPKRKKATSRRELLEDVTENEIHVTQIKKGGFIKRSIKSESRENNLVRDLAKDNWTCSVKDLDVTMDVTPCKIVLKRIQGVQEPSSSHKYSKKGSSESEEFVEEKEHSSFKQETPMKKFHSNTVQKKQHAESSATSNNSLFTTKNSEHEIALKGKKLIVVVPEFEKFPSKVLQDLILILRGTIPALPFVLVMGIATSVAAIHRSLPYRMSACLSIKAFQSPPSVLVLNSVLEEILFSPEFMFRLGNKTFCFLMDAFLYYDLSVKGFIQSIKFCLMEHFCGQNWKELCCHPQRLDQMRKLTTKDIAAVRKLPSFSTYVKSIEEEKEKEKLMNDDLYAQKVIIKLLKKLHNKLQVFHLALKCLNLLVSDLPKKPLGTHVRELYGMAASSPIIKTSEYRECIQFLGFLSRDELVTKLDKIISLLQNANLTSMSTFSEKMSCYRKNLQEAGMSAVSPKKSPQKSPQKSLQIDGKMTRYAFKEKLMELSKTDKNQSPFEKMREEFLNYLSVNVFPQMLKPIVTLPLIEVILFDNFGSVRTHIVGTPRAAIHTALNDPHFYLECECCEQSKKDTILASMPDLCIAYKLYRECGRMINLYDWLQAFSAVIDPVPENEEQREVKPQVQARFTRSVAELQFMGFLKTSSRKVDHVTKLYFDGGF